jgi:cytochrome c oxidase subunit 2
VIPADDPDAWDNYIRESIIDPAAKKRKGFESGAQMPSFAGRFNEKEMAGIIAYIRSLSDKGSADSGAGGNGNDGSGASGEDNSQRPKDDAAGG